MQNFCRSFLLIFLYFSQIERLNGCILEKNEKISKLEQTTKNFESKLINEENELNQQKNKMKELIENINLKNAETISLQESQEKCSKLENEKNKLETKLSVIFLKKYLNLSFAL